MLAPSLRAICWLFTDYLNALRHTAQLSVCALRMAFAAFELFLLTSLISRHLLVMETNTALANGDMRSNHGATFRMADGRCRPGGYDIARSSSAADDA